ncbi:MAG: helix-turn-helix domain-containing protein [Planctomycetota bacterium]|jgi:excisionase family DNA binding protein
MPLMTTKELAAYLNLSVASVYRLVAQKAIPHIRVNGSVRFRKESIDARLKELEVASSLEEAGTSPIQSYRKGDENHEE